MKVEFIALQRARSDLLGILERRTRTALDALAMAQVFLADIELPFKKYAGAPTDARLIRRAPEGWWWLYVEGVWLGFISADRRRGIIGGVIKTITLVEVRTRLPGVLSLPA